MRVSHAAAPRAVARTATARAGAARGLVAICRAVVVLGLSACATAYHPVGFAGGYSDVVLGEDLFQVGFHGNGYTSAERAADFALLRSAEVARDHGFPYFVLLAEQASERRTFWVEPTTTTATATRTGSTVRATATTTGGDVSVIAKPSTRNTVHGLKEKPAVGAAYEAAVVIRSLRAKYRLSPLPQ